MSSEGENDSCAQPSTTPVVYKEKYVLTEVDEKVVRDAPVAKNIGGHIVGRTPSGAVDVFSENEVAGVKQSKQ